MRFSQCLEIDLSEFSVKLDNSVLKDTISFTKSGLSMLVELRSPN